MEAQAIQKQELVTLPDFSRLRRQQKQMFWVSLFSVVYTIGFSLYITITSDYSLVFGLITLAILVLYIFVLRTYFSPKQAMLLSGTDSEITVHFTPYSSRSIPVSELKSAQWAGNQLSLTDKQNNVFRIQIGWMSYSDNKAVRNWIEEISPGR